MDYDIVNSQDLIDANIEADKLLEISQGVYDVIPELMLNHTEERDGKFTRVQVSQTLWDDSGLYDWAHLPSNAALIGGGKFLWDVIKNPTSDTALLIERQRAILEIPPHMSSLLREKASAYEKDVLWLYNLPELKDAWPLNTLFPMIPLVKIINHIPPALTLFQFYRSSIQPWTNMVVPLSTFIGPWMYMRRTLKIRMSFMRYCRLIYSALKVGLSPSNSMRTNIYTYSSLFIYIFFYIYGIIQSFQGSAMMSKMLTKLNERMTGIRKFVATAHDVLKTVSPNCIQAFLPASYKDIPLSHLNIPSGMSGLYTLMTNKNAKTTLQTLCNVMWIIDAGSVCSDMIRYRYQHLRPRQCCFAQFIDGNNKSTKFWNMGHVGLLKSSKNYTYNTNINTNGEMLSDSKEKEQVRNPASLEKSLVITGPNAAGKSTYVRSILTNILLSQSLGIVCAERAHVVPLHALGTFMRISDQLGTSSLFEAEVKRCAELISQAEQTSMSGLRATYFLDEPMHSTPPIEGSATSKAVLEYIGKLPGVTVLITTHYHDIVTMDSKYFHNISMDAIAEENREENREEKEKEQDGPGKTKYIFPYKIQRGPSFKCIALELLEKNQLPTGIVQEAIRIKNQMLQRNTTFTASA